MYKRQGFAEVEPGVTVSYDPTCSGAGITGATDKTLDIGLSSRALKDDEKNDVDGTIVLQSNSHLGLAQPGCVVRN